MKTFWNIKRQNICNSLNKKATADGVMSNRELWNAVKPFLT